MSKFKEYFEAVQRMNIQESHYVFEFVDHCEDNNIKEPTEKDMTDWAKKHFPGDSELVVKVLKKNLDNIKEIIK